MREKNNKVRMSFTGASIDTCISQIRAEIKRPILIMQSCCAMIKPREYMSKYAPGTSKIRGNYNIYDK